MGGFLFEDTSAKDDAKADSALIVEKVSRQNSREATSKIRVDEVSPEKCSHENSGEAASEICEIKDSDEMLSSVHL
jgi:hypothetical protein